MSVIAQLASSLDRNDEEPNIALAEKIAKTNDRQAVDELAEHVQGKNKAIASDCIKVLYEIGKRNPQLIADKADIFVKLLMSKNNRLLWGAMTALGQIVDLKASDLAQHLDLIQSVTTKGSAITQDWGIRVLAGIAKNHPASEKAILAYLVDFLGKCRPKDVVRHAESAQVAITAANRELFLEVLNRRRADLNASALKRVDKVMKQVSAL